MKKRAFYLTATIILLVIEVLIALYIHDDFIRPFVGDAIVVIVIYTFVRIFMPEKCRLLPLYIFLFAVAVELLQGIHIVNILGVADNKFLRVLIGDSFDIMDILCYGAGCILLGLYEYCITKSTQTSHSSRPHSPV